MASAAARVALLYVLIGALWIVFSDLAAEAMVGADAATYARLQTLKGWAFVAVSGLVIYLLVHRSLARIAASQQTLHAAEERFRQTFEQAQVGLGHADLAGHWLWVNPRLAAILGCAPAELHGRELWLTLGRHADDAEGMRRLVAGDAARVSGVRRVRKPDGTATWVALTLSVARHAAGVPDRLVAVVEDVGPQRRAERRRRRSEERFRALIERTSDITAILDPAGRVLYASPGLSRVLGFGAAELTGRRILRLVDPADRHALIHEYRRLLAEPGRTAGRELRLRHHSGTWRVVDIHGRNLVDHPAVRGIVVNGRDVTDARAVEDQLRQAQKMEAIGRLAGGIAHDFNNTLTAIRGYADIALADLPEGSTVAGEVQEIARAAERAGDLTRQLLAVSRQQVLHPVVVDPNQVVVDVERLLRRLIGSDVELRLLLDPDLPAVRTDRAQLEQVLLNLAINARDAMPAGGVLTVTTRAEMVATRARPPRGTTLSPGAYAVLAVSDTGTGMSDDIAHHIFEPFFTTKEPGRGTGLGLSTVYGVVNQAGGHIVLDTALGRGTTFRIYLPGTAAGVQRAEEPRPLPEARAGGTVLLVEDEPAVRSLVRRILDRQGLRVLEASDAAAAVDLASHEPGTIDLLLADLGLPDRPGAELASILRQQRPDLRVLFMSGHAAGALVQIDSSGSFIEKPFSPDELVLRVQELLGVVPPAVD
jgi:two-component system, cell cycle sensor histidine kinase and response regulator CckA